MVVDLHIALELLKERLAPVSVSPMHTVETLRLAHDSGWPGGPPQRHQVGIGAEPVAIFRHWQHALEETAGPRGGAGRGRGGPPRGQKQKTPSYKPPRQPEVLAPFFPSACRALPAV